MDNKNNYIVTRNIIDGDTGELLSKKKYMNWSGWKDNAYKFRSRGGHCRIFFDSDFDLDAKGWNLFMKLCKMMNKNNLLIGYYGRNQNIFKPHYYPMTKKDIFESLKSEMSLSTFNRVFKKLEGKYVKKIQVEKMNVYAVNPAFAAKIEFLPIYLYIPFKIWIDPFLSEVTRKKFENLELSTWE